ncbi:N-acetyl-glucosamine-6-phosphate deacetylase [Marasmius sp. AFHP31]|nr:N-acetyl-glucosamine-6-phosphate deacetylase [Marasmius sp. AFHP31]
MDVSEGILCYTNCSLVQEDGSFVKKDLWVDKVTGRILDPQNTFFVRKERPNETVDLHGSILSPGLIDIQINGAYGFDFSSQDYDEEAYQKGLNMVVEKIVETGVTSLVPTVVTQDRALYPNALQRLRPSSDWKSAAILGWHAEGPFLDSSKRGAHSPAWLADAPEGFKSIEETYGQTNVSTDQDWRKAGALDGDTVGARIVTLAPEVQGVLNAIEELTNRGVVVSMGHSAATSVVAMEAAKRGASLITHLFNAMPQLHHRDPAIIGLLGASSKSQRTPPIEKLAQGTSDRAEALDSSASPIPTSGVQRNTSSAPQFKRPFYTIIADGVHLHPQSIKVHHLLQNPEYFS